MSVARQFGVPVVVDPVHMYGEPDQKVAPMTGTNFYNSGPWGTGTQRSIWNQSTDGGMTYHPLHKPRILSPAQSDSNIPCPNGVEPSQCPGGGDTEISIDRNDRVYYSDLAALSDLKTARWNFNNTNMTTNLIDLAGPQAANGYDRQWFAMWDPPTPPADYTGPLPVNYLSYAEALVGSPNCNLEGKCQAASYTTTNMANGTQYKQPPTVEYAISNDGPLEIDQKTGTVFQAVSVDNLNDVGVAILKRGSDPNNPALTQAQVVKAFSLPAGTTTRALFPVIGFDSARNLYLAWVTRATQASSANPNNFWQIFYTYSTAAGGWTDFHTPVRLSAGDAKTNVMPWAVAGKAGHLAVVWYGTDNDTANPSTAPGSNHMAWHVYMAMVDSANTNNPTITQYRLTRHPMHYGSICLEGTGCIASQGNRNLADFFYVTVDPRDGAPVVTYNDTSNEMIQFPNLDGTADHRGGAVVMTIRQKSGPGLWGTNVTNPYPTLVKPTFPKDRSGDANFDPIYDTNSNVPALDFLGASVYKKDATHLEFTFHMKDLSSTALANAFADTGATSLEYVMRWSFGPVTATQGERFPIYYVGVQFLPEGNPTFFAGSSNGTADGMSIDLCSVSACTPHITDYAAPPRNGTFTETGTVHQEAKPSAHWHIDVDVNLADIGNPAVGDLLESFSAYTFARFKSASLPITQGEGEAGITPVMVDGVCCTNAPVSTTKPF